MNRRFTLIAAIFAVMLAIAIVPAAFAENGSQGDPGQGGQGQNLLTAPRFLGPPIHDNVSRNDSVRIGNGPRGLRNGTGPRNWTGNFTGNRSQLREELQVRAKEIRTAINDKMKQLHEEVKLRRDELKADVAQFKAKIKETQDRMKELQANYTAERDGWNQAKKNLSDSCKGTNSTACKDAREQFNDEGKRFIGNAAEQMLTQISDVKTRIQTSIYLDNATVNAVVAQLDAKTTIITLDKQAVDALQNSSDVNATKTAATQLRDDWQGAQVTLRLSRGLLTHVQFQNFIDHLTTMSTRFTEARDTLAGQGKNVTQLDIDLASFNAKLGTAATAFTSAKTSYVSAMATVKTDADASSLIKSTNDQLKAARDDVQSARDDLRAIIKDIKDQNVAVLNDVAAKIQSDEKANAATEVETEGGAP